MMAIMLECDAFGFYLSWSCSRNNAGLVFHKILAGCDSLLFKSLVQPKMSEDAK